MATPYTINQPVRGTDVANLMLRHNISADEMCELLHLNKAKLNALLSSDKPIKDVSIALLIRVYSEYPHLLPKFDVLEFYESQTGAEAEKLRHFGPNFGRESTAGYNWIVKGRPMSAQPLALGRLIKRLPEGYDDLKRMAIQEAKYRGVNPFKTGSWSKPASFDSANVTGRTYRKRSTPGVRPVKGSKAVIPMEKKK